MSIDNIFHRPAMAMRLAESIVKPNSVAASGLFLAAPRRTGKSTFMRFDLRPALENQDAIVIYIDLWEDRKVSPETVISSAIAETLNQYEGTVARYAKSAGLVEFNIATFKFSTENLGIGKSVTLSRALSTLSDVNGKLIVLIIDEAQQAATTNDGKATLFALKAARDEVNSSLYNGIRIVCTGSERNKLAALCNSKAEAFYGASIRDFPPLGKDFTDWFVESNDVIKGLDKELVWTVFSKHGHEPELLRSALDAADNAAMFGDNSILMGFEAGVRNFLEDKVHELRTTLLHLPDIQHAVLSVMAANGNNFAPFQPATIAAYKTALAKRDFVGTIKETNIQSALTALSKKKLVWRSARGVYAMDESGIVDVLRADGSLDGLTVSTK